MKNLVLGTAILSVAASLVSTAVAQIAPAQNGKALVHVSSTVVRASNPLPTFEAVPAKLILQTDVDSKSTTPGTQINAKLSDTTRLADGTLLPRGTRLLGHVETVKVSDKNTDGSIALTFDRAQLKNGTVLPLKATIVNVAAPIEDTYDYAYELDGKSALPAYPVVKRIPLTKGTLGVHSDRASAQSGTIVCKAKNVDLYEGEQLKVALAALPETASLDSRK